MAKKDNGLTDPRLGTRILAEARLRRYELRVEIAIKAALRRQKAKAIEALQSQHLTAAAPPDPFDEASWDSMITDEVLPVVGDVLGDISQKVFNFLALPPEARARILGKIDLGARTDSFVSKVTNIGPNISARLMDELSTGVGKGESIDDLTDRIDTVFNIGDNIAERIARTETHGAAESTTHDSASAIAAAGYQVTKQWVATEDSRTRPDHADADGQEVDISETFQVGDDELQFPGDPDGSAEQTVNCRCSCTYSTNGNADPDSPDITDDSIDSENE